jgi:AcrR family transcriptional regulator
MGRPRKTTDMTAPVKIENAFWQLLRTDAYSNITIQKLADAAGVNRNAVYYHYENLDDVAMLLWPKTA